MTDLLPSRAAAPAAAAVPDERLLDVRQLAAYLGLDRSRLWLMRLLVASQRGPHGVRVAGHTHWWRRDVDLWLAEHDLADVLRGLGEDLISATAPIAV